MYCSYYKPLKFLLQLLNTQRANGITCITLYLHDHSRFNLLPRDATSSQRSPSYYIKSVSTWLHKFTFLSPTLPLSLSRPPSVGKPAKQTNQIIPLKPLNHSRNVSVHIREKDMAVHCAWRGMRGDMRHTAVVR
jgi:hypothetical protein